VKARLVGEVYLEQEQTGGWAVLLVVHDLMRLAFCLPLIIHHGNVFAITLLAPASPSCLDFQMLNGRRPDLLQ